MPLAHAIGKTAVQHALGAQEIEQLAPEGLAQCIFGQRRQHLEGAGGQKHPVGDQRMDVRVEGHQVTEGLYVQDEGGLTTRLHRPEAGLEESVDQAAELSEILTAVAKERPEKFWQGKPILARLK